MKPFSAIYYIKENKKKSILIIFMLFLTTLIFLAGNYVESVYYFWDRYMDYSDKMRVPIRRSRRDLPRRPALSQAGPGKEATGNGKDTLFYLGSAHITGRRGSRVLLRCHRRSEHPRVEIQSARRTAVRPRGAHRRFPAP